jgi:hypothetical protein
MSITIFLSAKGRVARLGGVSKGYMMGVSSSVHTVEAFPMNITVSQAFGSLEALD